MFTHIRIILLFLLLKNIVGFDPEQLEETCESECLLKDGNGNCKEPSEVISQYRNLDSEIKPPSIYCVADTEAVLMWEPITENHIAFLEILDGTKRVYSNFTSCNIITLDNLKPNGNYAIRLIRLIEGPERTYNNSIYIPLMTKEPSQVSTPVKSLVLDTLEYSNSTGHYTTKIKWETSREECYFHTVFYNNPMEDIYSEDLTKPDTPHFVKLSNLAFSGNYSFGIATKSTTNNKESEKVWVNFTVPSCIDTIGSLSVCVPSQPTNLSASEEVISVVNHKILYRVNVTWDEPKLTPDYYLCTIIASGRRTHVSQKVSGNETGTVFENVELGSNYHISITPHAQSGEGISARSYKFLDPAAILRAVYKIDKEKERKLQNLNETSPIIVKKESNWDIYYLSLIVFVIGVIMIVTIVVRIVLRRYHLPERNESRVTYKKNPTNDFNFTRDIGLGNPQSETLIDNWEVDPDTLSVNQVLGEGAFGVVRQAYLEVGDNRVKVAIKSLKDNEIVLTTKE